MYQIDNATAATTQPAATAAGTAGFFTDGNPATSTPATIVPAEWLNSVMMELANVVTGAGMTLSKSSYNQVLAAIRRIGQKMVVLADTGTANAYTATNSTPLVAATWVDGVTQAVKIANANTGASTYAPDGLPAIPIYGLGLQPLQGGELAANGTAVLMRTTITGVNSGNPICVLMECAGGAQQIAPATQSQHAMQLGQLSLAGHGQCWLTAPSATQLKLAPLNGMSLIIGGVPRQIPAAGVTVAPSTAASSFYYAYAFWTGSAISLEISTTTHAVDPATGVEIKSGDASRTLVGAVATNASGQFVMSATNRQVRNWFNRAFDAANFANPGSLTFTNTTAARISGSTDITTITWAGEALDVAVSGSCGSSGTGASIAIQAYVDGAPFGVQTATYSNSTGGMNFSSTGAQMLAEGLHTVSVYGSCTGGTTTVSTLTSKATTRG